MSRIENSRDGWPRTRRQIEEGIRQGLHPGAQLYVSRDLIPIADLAFGEAELGEPMRDVSILVWMSSGKPVTAVALAILWEEGLIRLDDTVSQHLPEFAQGGKELITIRHLLTHTGGIRSLNEGWPDKPWKEIVADICRRRLEPRWQPGLKAGYHTASSWFILGELVERLSGLRFSQFVRRRIFEPLGLTDSGIGISGERYRHLQTRMGKMYDTSGESPQEQPWTSREMISRPSPARSAFGPARSLGAFYEMLLGGGERRSVRLLTPQTVEALTARHRVGLYDHTFKHVMDWSLGLIPNSNLYGIDTVPYGYGKYSSASTVGHSGYQSSTGFLDRDNRLVVALIFNGMPGAVAHDRRMRLTLEAIYQDVGLAAE